MSHRTKKFGAPLFVCFVLCCVVRMVLFVCVLFCVCCCSVCIVVRFGFVLLCVCVLCLCLLVSCVVVGMRQLVSDLSSD